MYLQRRAWDGCSLKRNSEGQLRRHVVPVWPCVKCVSTHRHLLPCEAPGRITTRVPAVSTEDIAAEAAPLATQAQQVGDEAPRKGKDREKRLPFWMTNPAVVALGEDAERMRTEASRSKHAISLGRRGVCKGLHHSIINHWRTHECCRVWRADNRTTRKRFTNLRELAEQLEAMTGGTCIHLNGNYITLYRGRDYVQPPVPDIKTKAREYATNFKKLLAAKGIPDDLADEVLPILFGATQRDYNTAKYRKDIVGFVRLLRERPDGWAWLPVMHKAFEDLQRLAPEGSVEATDEIEGADEDEDEDEDELDEYQREARAKKEEARQEAARKADEEEARQEAEEAARNPNEKPPPDEWAPVVSVQEVLIYRLKQAKLPAFSRQVLREMMQVWRRNWPKPRPIAYEVYLKTHVSQLCRLASRRPEILGMLKALDDALLENELTSPQANPVLDAEQYKQDLMAMGMPEQLCKHHIFNFFTREKRLVRKRGALIAKRNIQDMLDLAARYPEMKPFELIRANCKIIEKEDTIPSRMQNWRDLTGKTEAEVVAMWIKAPALMAITNGLVHEHMKGMLACLPITEEKLRKVVAIRPTLASRMVKVSEDFAKLLKLLLSPFPDWQKQVPDLTVDEWATMLQFGEGNLFCISYAQKEGHYPSMSLAEVLTKGAKLWGAPLAQHKKDMAELWSTNRGERKVKTLIAAKVKAGGGNNGLPIDPSSLPENRGGAQNDGDYGDYDEDEDGGAPFRRPLPSRGGRGAAAGGRGGRGPPRRDGDDRWGSREGSGRFQSSRFGGERAERSDRRFDRDGAGGDRSDARPMPVARRVSQPVWGAKSPAPPRRFAGEDERREDRSRAPSTRGDDEPPRSRRQGSEDRRGGSSRYDDDPVPEYARDRRGEPRDSGRSSSSSWEDDASPRRQRADDAPPRRQREDYRDRNEPSEDRRSRGRDDDAPPRRQMEERDERYGNGGRGTRREDPQDAPRARPASRWAPAGDREERDILGRVPATTAPAKPRTRLFDREERGQAEEPRSREPVPASRPPKQDVSDGEAW